MARDVTDARPRKKDVTPDSQRAEYEERGGETTSIGDEIDSAYEQGRREGGSSSDPTRVARFTKPAGLPAVGAPFLAELLIISANSFVNEHRPPLPSRIMVAGGIFGLLGLAKGQAANAAAVFGWGLVLATFYSAPIGKQPGGITALTTVGKFLQGEYGRPGGASQGGALANGTFAPPPATFSTGKSLKRT